MKLDNSFESFLFKFSGNFFFSDSVIILLKFAYLISSSFLWFCGSIISESKKIFTFINVVKKAFWPWDITEYRIVIKKRKAIKIPRKP